MKQIYLKFSMLILCLVAGLSSAWAQTTVTFTFKKDADITYTAVGKSGGGEPCTVTKSNVTLSGSNAYTIAGKTLSCYAKSTLTITAPGNITKIDLAYNGQVFPFDEAPGSEGKANNKFSASGEHDATYTPASAASSITLNNTNGGKTELLSLKVTYTTSSEAYKVTFNANSNGTCATSDLTESAAGAGVTLPTCTANSGYEFIGWATTANATVANAGKAGETYNPAAATTLYAVYKKVCSLTINTPENGSIAVTNNGATVSSGDNLQEGDILTIKATPSKGYKFTSWNITGATAASTSKTTTLTVGTSNITIGASFEISLGLTVTYDFNDANAYPEGFPTATGTTTTKPTSFTISDNPIIIYAPGGYYIINNGKDASRGLIFGKSSATSGKPKDGTAYLEFPAKEGYCLTQVVATTTTGMGANVKLNVFDSSWNTMSTQLTTPSTVTDKDTYTFDLETSNANTAYRFAAATSSKNIQLDNIVLTYEKATSSTITIGSTGYATYYNSMNAYTMPDDCEGFVASVSGKSFKLGAAYEGGDIVPAGEPLIIYSVDPGDKTLAYTTSTEETYKSAGMNDLDGTDASTALTADADSYFYALSLDKNGANVGFYWMAADGAAFTNGAHKAYLKVAKSAGAKTIGYAFNEDATAIKSIAPATAADGKIYDMTGREVKAPKAGLYIVNGVKKYIK